jgi:hypothetical protein
MYERSWFSNSVSSSSSLFHNGESKSSFQIAPQVSYQNKALTSQDKSAAVYGMFHSFLVSFIQDFNPESVESRTDDLRFLSIRDRSELLQSSIIGVDESFTCKRFGQH